MNTTEVISRVYVDSHGNFIIWTPFQYGPVQVDEGFLEAGVPLPCYIVKQYVMDDIFKHVGYL